MKIETIPTIFDTIGLVNNTLDIRVKVVAKIKDITIIK